MQYSNKTSYSTPSALSAADALALMAILSSVQNLSLNFLDTLKAHLPTPVTELDNAAGIPVRLIEMQLTPVVESTTGGE